VVERCMREGLVGGEGFAIDASVIKADANRSRKAGGDDSHSGTSKAQPEGVGWGRWRG
jgi:hypothetical protein